MLNLFNGIFVAPIEFYEHQLPPGIGLVVVEKSHQQSYENLDYYLNEKSSDFRSFLSSTSAVDKECIFYLSSADFIKVISSWYTELFDVSDVNGFYEFLKWYQTDIRLKANRFDYSEKTYYAMRSFRLEKIDLPKVKLKTKISNDALGFELLLYNALLTDEPMFWEPLLKLIEALTWKKIVYDWLVLRNQIINAFSNDLSLLLKENIVIPEDPNERLLFLKNHKQLNWIFDPDFRPDNWQYVRDNYDLTIYANLYSSWIRHRRAQDLDNENSQYKRLIEIFSLIRLGQWRELLIRDIRENWVSVYVETSEMWKFNLALVGRIYDLYNQERLDKLSFLKLTPGLVSI
jgi:hypothetical protein